jgi:hypothetical protein
MAEPDRRVSTSVLKTLGDAQSFDHEPVFIELCLDLVHLTPPAPDAVYRFVER